MKRTAEVFVDIVAAGQDSQLRCTGLFMHLDLTSPFPPLSVLIPHSLFRTSLTTVARPSFLKLKAQRTSQRLSQSLLRFRLQLQNQLFRKVR